MSATIDTESTETGVSTGAVTSRGVISTMRGTCGSAGGGVITRRTGLWWGGSIAIPSRTTATAAPTTTTTGIGSQLLTRLLEDGIGIISRPDDTHHQIVRVRSLVQQQSGTETKPAVELLLLIGHWNSDQLGLRPASATIASLGGLSRGECIR